MTTPEGTHIAVPKELPRVEGCIDGNLNRFDRREKCGRCGGKNPIGFTATAAVWDRINELATLNAKAWNNRPAPLPQGPFNILCIHCFTEIGDWHGVAWDEGLVIDEAVSRYTVTVLEQRAEAAGV